ncbi:anaerobic dehydrogenase [Ensifer canadensis]|uniref:anaerobic dehydrogenase n=1 Tax=Ensifer canadensis TaxID=555315 RepID=UPI0035E3C962
MKACDLPVNLGDNPIAQAQLEKLWITDRRRLLECYRRHLALRDFVVDRDDALRGSERSDAK